LIQLIKFVYFAKLRGERVKDQEYKVKLVSVKKNQRHPQFGSAKGLITMADDFDAPLENFKEYMP